MVNWIVEIYGVYQKFREPDVSEVDIKSVVDYAEYKHKDDVATPTKKWKFL